MLQNFTNLDNSFLATSAPRLAGQASGAEITKFFAIKA